MADETTTCPACSGAGDLPDRRWLESIVHLLLMCGEHGASSRAGLHPWLDTYPIRAEGEPSAAFADLTARLAGRPPRGPLGHDAIDRWAATNAILTAAGLNPKEWGLCPTCKGEGEVPATAEK